MTIDQGSQRRPAFQREIRSALRYEEGLVVKALAVLIVVAAIALLRTLYFALR
jgi:hypothetical protein